MAIDDPIDAAAAAVAKDEREQSPIPRFLATIVDAVPPLKALLAPLTVPLAACVRQRAESNQELLVAVLINELRSMKKKLEGLGEEQQRFFLSGEFLGLVIDGLQKAQNVRSRERVERIGKILGYAADQGTSKPADYTEEMMRVAMELSDDDVRVLREICRVQGHLLKADRDRVGRFQAYQSWSEVKPQQIGLSDGEVLSICSKLESYGFLFRVENPKFNLNYEGPIRFALLKKGKDFISYIQGATPESGTPG